MSDQEIEEAYSEHLNTSDEIKKAIQNTNFDTAIDYGDIALDEYVTDGVLKEIPIVKTVVGVAKGALKIKEIHFAKKILNFLKTFHSGRLPEDKMVDFRIKFEDDVKYRHKVLEHIMIYCDRFMEVEKAAIFANLFLGYLNGKYDWEGFISLSHCLEAVNMTALSFLDEMANEPKYYLKSGYTEFNDNIVLLSSAGLIQQIGQIVQVTVHGIYFHIVGIKGDINHVFVSGNANG